MNSDSNFSSLLEVLKKMNENAREKERKVEEKELKENKYVDQNIKECLNTNSVLTTEVNDGEITNSTVRVSSNVDKISDECLDEELVQKSYSKVGEQIITKEELIDNPLTIKLHLSCFYFSFFVTSLFFFKLVLGTLGHPLNVFLFLFSTFLFEVFLYSGDWWLGFEFHFHSYYYCVYLFLLF
jgi:hypothetical protein